MSDKVCLNCGRRVISDELGFVFVHGAIRYCGACYDLKNLCPKFIKFERPETEQLEFLFDYKPYDDEAEHA